MKLDLDALERNAALMAHPDPYPSELAALVRIARAAVAWRDAWSSYDGQSSPSRSMELLDALREAGL